MPEPLVTVTNPHTGEVLHVHPWVAEHGQWLPPDDGTAVSREALQALLPGWSGFVRELAELVSDDTVKTLA